MDSVRELINEINTTRTQASSKAKDEIRVMKAMLNEPNFKVDVYGKSGVEGQYCPYEESRIMVSNIIKNTTKISQQEAMNLANSYEFGNQESAIMVGLSKESNISISKKIKEERVGSTPKKVGVNADGTDKYESVDGSIIPEHGSLKVYSSCPSWLK